jgi:hypothetical protein
LKHEPDAVALLQKVINEKKEHESFKCEAVGLVISTSTPYLAASPDRVCSCLCHDKYVLEVKCPPTLHGKNIEEHARRTKGFCLLINNDTNKLYLDPKHEYYYQVNIYL